MASSATVDFLDLPIDVLNELLQPFECPDVEEEQPERKLETAPGPVAVSRQNEATVGDVNSFIDGQRKVNTVRSTDRDIRNVQRWLFEHKKEPRLIELIPADWLNDYLAEMFISIRKVDGSEYEPSSLEDMKNSIERHLKNNGYKTSLRDRSFTKAMQALCAKKMELKKQGLGRKSKAAAAISSSDENAFFMKGTMGTNTPESLQFTIFYYFGKMFGLRGRDEQRKLRFGDIALKVDSSGTEFLEYSERDSKVMDGSKRNDYRSTTPRIYSCGGDRDPVKIYQIYVSKRPTEMNTLVSPFYLLPQKTGKMSDLIWYYPRPMGTNTLGALMKRAASDAGLDTTKRITNHSVRKTCVTTLSKAGVPPTKIMQITGHRNISSITAYDAALSEEEHKTISSVLTQNIGHRPCVVSSPSPLQTPTATATRTQDAADVPTPTEDFDPLQMAKPLFSGAYINNLTLNISMK